MIEVQISNQNYPVIIERKKKNRNTYLRVKDDFSIHITTNYFTKEKELIDLVKENILSIEKMIKKQQLRKENQKGFYYLGKKYDIVYTNQIGIFLYDDKVLMSHGYPLDKWYRKQAENVFLAHLNEQYQKFSQTIPYPKLKIRLMKTRWGVCKPSSKTITLNLELIKRDSKYLDYVIVHELSHFIHPNHSQDFWNLVKENCYEYQKLRREMKKY